MNTCFLRITLAELDEAAALILRRTAAGAARIVQLSEDEIAEAMRIYYDDTHQVAKGAGAAPLAALIQERDRHAGRSVGMILSGGNIERALQHGVGQ